MKVFYTASRIIVALLLIILSEPATAQPPTITYTTVLSGFTAPVNVTNAGDGSNRLFIVQQDGVVMVKDGATLSQFADFGTTTAGGAGIITYGGEQGLLSLEFHPDYNGT